MSNRKVLKLAMAFGLSVGASAQTKGKLKMSTVKMQRCVEPIEAYGEHVRWTPEEHVKLLLEQKESREKQDGPYREWEAASHDLDWFSGQKRVPLSQIKSHMPRAMLLSLRFPVDQNPPVDPVGLKRLIDAEVAYEATMVRGPGYAGELMKKYNIGPGIIFDQDMGGATPQGGCNRYEEFDYVLPEENKTR